MAIKLRALVKSPSRVTGGDLVTVTKENGVHTVSLALSDASETASIADQSAATLMLVTPGLTDDAADIVERITVDDFLTQTGSPANANLTAIAGLTSAADTFAYFTGAGTAAIAAIAAFGRSIVAGANAAAVMTTLGFSAFFQTLVGCIDAAAVRAALGVSSGSGDVVSTNNGSDFASIPTTRVNLGVQAARGGGPTLINGVFVPSASAGALTIAIKTLAAANPSASDPVYVVVPDTINGDYDIIAITAATSLVLSSGSTLGVASATPFNLHLLGFNDGGTFRLGAMNARISEGIRTLTPGTLESSTAEGGAGAADTAGTIYTGTAATSKDWTYLGRLEFPAGITTAGTWTWTTGSATGKIVPFVPGMKLPGDVVQSRGMSTLSGTVSTSTSYANTNASIAITPKSAANAVSVVGAGTGSAVAGVSIYVTLARGGTAIGVAAGALDNGGTVNDSMSLGPHLDWPGTGASTTYTIMLKSGSGGSTVVFNESSATGALIAVSEVQG